MLKWLARRRIANFERQFDYDAAYMREILETAPRAMVKIGTIVGLAAYRGKVPSAPWHAAHIATAMAEDCGPCTQLCVTMAERDGVSSSIVRALIGRSVASMPPEVALTFRFANAVQNHDPIADQLREEIRGRWGDAAVVSLALSMAAGRFFPFVKYALGHGRACTRVVVDGAPMPVVSKAA